MPRPLMCKCAHDAKTCRDEAGWIAAQRNGLRAARFRASVRHKRAGDASNSLSKRYLNKREMEDEMGSGLARGALLWLLGVPLSVIILIALFTNYI